MRIVYVLSGLAIAASAAGLASVATARLPCVGCDRDAHGCIGSAGYSWCAGKQKCLRTWEEACTAPATSSSSIAGGAAASTSTRGGLACSRKDCPPVGMPNTRCSDGTIGGPSCERKPNGSCGIVIRTCPKAASKNRTP